MEFNEKAFSEMMEYQKERLEKLVRDNPEIITEVGSLAKPPALDKQVGGSHYKGYSIQPIEFIEKNGLGFAVGNIIKYACRFENKGGREDLEKVIHYAELLIDIKYGAKKEGS